MTTSFKNLLVLTPGDPDGIGPEITWKALQTRFTSHEQSKVPILCVGAREPFEKLGAPIHELDPKLPFETSVKDYFQNSAKTPVVWLHPAPRSAPSGQFLPGFQVGWSIETATRLILERKASALVTGPISKERLQKGGYIYPGHTEFLAALCSYPAAPQQGTQKDAPEIALEVTMMLANDLLRVSLVTTHVALKDVSRVLTRDKIQRAVLQTAESLIHLWKISRPRIAVAALNPHAGESGLFGTEEIDTIQPILKEIQKNYPSDFELIGPLPADTLFANHILRTKEERFDAVVCMYHDQGLIPVKLLDFHRTVNITLGLPIIRTSVDHGVGFDIAGKGIANPSSLQAAIELAVTLSDRKIQ